MIRGITEIKIEHYDIVATTAIKAGLKRLAKTEISGMVEDPDAAS
jgi:hypothetical protein